MPRTSKAQTGALSCGRSHLRVVLADSHVILRQGLRAILDAEPDLEVIGEAGSVASAIALVRRLQPDVLITEVSFEHNGAMQAIGELRRECIGMRIVLLTGQDRPETVHAALNAGAHAYIVKEAPVEDLLRAIRSEGAEFNHPPPAVAEATLRNGERAAVRPALHPLIAAMTVRQREVLIGIALGYSSKSIAGHLGRSVKTIEKHRFKVMHMLGLRNAAAATRFAIDQGLLDTAGECQEWLPQPRFPRN
jgi:DNA-binding NarL/FixJ family response regulator